MSLCALRHSLRSLAPLGALALGALLAILSIGCEQATTSSEAAPSASNGDSNSPQALLKQMVATYEKAGKYADTGEFHFRMMEQGHEAKESPAIPFSVTLERPNKIRVHGFGASLVADGKQLRATVQEIPDQVLAADAPPVLTMQSIYGDSILTKHLGGGIDVKLPQLKLLLASDPLKDDLQAAKKVILLDDQTLEGDRCRRVSVTNAEGTTTFWIHATTHLLRRIDLPTDEIKKKADPEGRLAQFDVWADFKGAQVNRPIAEHAFEFEAPQGVRLVKRFLPPPPSAPSQLLGKKPDEFSFVDLKDSSVDRQSLDGKIVVLDMWATWCGWCFKGLPNLEKVYQKYKDNDKVMILAVSTDDANVSNDALQAAFEKPGLHIPILRDPKRFADQVFNVTGLPSTFILGPDGTVQSIEEGYNPNLIDELTKKLETLLAGGNLAVEEIQRYEQKRQEYEDELKEVTIGETSMVELPKTDIAAKSEPTSLKLSELWTAEGLKEPGNILIVGDENQAPKILVLDGFHKLSELGVDGKLLASHELEIPDSAAVTFLRTALDSQGKRYFAAFASAQQQLFLFDESWTKVLAYPDASAGPHSGLGDVQFGDLDGDGQPEINVGYWSQVGVQNVTLDGHRQWSNRSAENVLRIVVSNPDEQRHSRLLCTNSRGTLMPIDFQGKQGVDIRVADRALHTIVSGEPADDGAARLCGLSSNEQAVTTALGIDLDGKELWHYDLPAGIHERPIETVAFGHVLKDRPGQWLLPAADGSIHILGVDGQLIDKFNYGQQLTGIATAVIDGAPVLLISTTDGLKAWRVEPPTQ